MPSIVKIEQIRKKRKDYLLVLSDGREIPLSRQMIDRYSLEAGISITAEKLNLIRLESEMTRSEEYVLYLLARRSYSSGHLVSKLVEKGFGEKVIRATMAILRERDLIDDTAYARELVESILRRKPAGRNYLVGCLRRKFIPRSLAESVVDELLAIVDETESAARLLRARWGYFSKFELETARRKAYNYLLRRSIGYRAAKEAFDLVLKESNEN